MTSYTCPRGVKCKFRHLSAEQAKEDAIEYEKERKMPQKKPAAEPKAANGDTGSAGKSRTAAQADITDTTPAKKASLQKAQPVLSKPAATPAPAPATSAATPAKGNVVSLKGISTPKGMDAPLSTPVGKKGASGTSQNPIITDKRPAASTPKTEEKPAVSTPSAGAGASPKPAGVCFAFKNSGFCQYAQTCRFRHLTKQQAAAEGY